MIFYDKKRTIYALLVSAVVVALFFSVGIPLMYEWYHNKFYPYDSLRIYQSDKDHIKISALAVFTDDYPDMYKVDNQEKKIIFKLLEWNNSSWTMEKSFPINWNVGYKMCYENQYGQYCFGTTK